MKNIIFLFTLITFFSCQRKYVYLPDDNRTEGQIIYSNGNPSHYVKWNGADVRVDLVSYAKRDIRLIFAITNKTDSLFTFDPTGIMVTGYDKDGIESEFDLYSADEFVRRTNRNTALIVGGAILLTAATVTVANNNTSNTNNNDVWIYDPICYPQNRPLPPPSPNDGLLRTQTLMSGEVMYGNIRIKGHRRFTRWIKVELPQNNRGAPITLYYDGSRIFTGTLAIR